MSFLDASSMAQMAAALGAVLLLIFAVSRFAGRYRTALRRSEGRLGVRSVCALDPRRRLVLIACDGREGLLLTGPGGDQFLGWLPGA